jgi:putative acetyltransferase
MQRIAIRPEHEADVSAIRQIHRAAFQSEGEAILVEKIRESQWFIPPLSLVALVAAKAVGHVLLSYIDLVSGTSSKVLGLAPLAVLPEFQRQGIGSLLVNKGIDLADEQGEPLIIVLGDPAFYSRFGFMPASRFAISCPFPGAEDAFMVKPLSNFSPDLHGKVIYPEAFAVVS